MTTVRNLNTSGRERRKGRSEGRRLCTPTSQLTRRDDMADGAPRNRLTRQNAAVGGGDTRAERGGRRETWSRMKSNNNGEGGCWSRTELARSSSARRLTSDKLTGEWRGLLESGRGGASANLSLLLPASSLVSPTSRQTRGAVSQLEHYSVAAPPSILTDLRTRTGTTASWCLDPSAPSSSPPCYRSHETEF